MKADILISPSASVYFFVVFKNLDHFDPINLKILINIALAKSLLIVI
jgi:hypothetical protein